MNDYEILKKNYGERFAKLCRMLFPTILEEEGKLSSIIMQTFAPSKRLYDDLYQDKPSYLDNSTTFIEDFKNLIMNKYVLTGPKYKDINETPEELFKKAGYTLYKCETNKDVHSFKKYWKKEEELCTFRDEERINTHTIFFAVKHNAEDIKRENFKTPRRQDEYGTSVICLQFSKGQYQTLSIKNRYNHFVENPDATFSNDLENIYSGLTDSFYKYYGMSFQRKMEQFQHPSIILANDGKYYRHNYKVIDSYFCADNIIIENGKVIKFNKDRYIVFDNFLLDKKEKTIKNLGKYNDGFLDAFNNIQNIEVTKQEDGNRLITIYMPNKKPVLITINKNNELIKLADENIDEIGDDFLCYNKSLVEVYLPNVKNIGNDFLTENSCLEKIIIDKVKKVDDSFLHINSSLKQINIPNLEKVGSHFLYNANMDKFYAPALKKADWAFLGCAEVKNVYLPLIENLKDASFMDVRKVDVFNAPKLKTVSGRFLMRAENIGVFNAPLLERTDYSFMLWNVDVKEFNAPRLKEFCGGLEYNHELKLKIEAIVEKNNKDLEK